jgi:hypothetical protein
MALSNALSIPIRAGIAAARGDRLRAVSLFAEAVQALEAVDMNLYAAAWARSSAAKKAGHNWRGPIPG